MPVKINLAASLVAASCMLLPVVSAAVPGAETPVIIVTPTRTIQSENISGSTVFVLNSEHIKKSGVNTTSELLRGIPGVQVDDLFGNGTEVTIGMRGFSSTANANTLILVNGRRLNHSDTAGPDLHHIFPRDIQRIEVLVGSAGTLYGDQAVGGVINIITYGSVDDVMEATVKLGSFNYRAMQFLTSQKITEAAGYRLSAETFKSNHYRDHNEEYNTNIQGLFDYRTGEHYVFFQFQHIEGELELPGALIESEYSMDPTQINAGFINDFLNEDTTVNSIGYQFERNDNEFSVDFTQRKTDADILQSFRNAPSPLAGITSRENRSLNPKFSGVTRITNRKVPYVIGLDIERVNYELYIPNSYGVTSASNEQQTDSLFFQLNPQLSNQLMLTLGMRISSVDNSMTDGYSFPGGQDIDDDVAVKELGLVYRPHSAVKWSLRYDENFRFAKVNELAQAESGTILETQTGKSYEAGVEWMFATQQVTATLYQLILENEIVFDPTVGPDFGFGPTGANVNLDKTQRDGLALSLSSLVNSSLSIKTELGIVDARFKSGTFKGNKISGVANKILKLRANYQVSHNISGFFEALYTAKHYAQGDNANSFEKVDAIPLMNAGLNVEYGDLSITFRINNLADKTYSQFITNNGYGAAYQPSPERNYLMSVSYRF